MEKEEKKRTMRQNKALHLMFTMLADNLNEHGFDMKKTLKNDVDIPWSGESVKEFLWRPVQKAQLQKQSTTELTTKEIDAVFDTLNRHLGSVTGITVMFPSVEEIIQEQLGRKRVE
jgi:hypothetical protein